MFEKLLGRKVGGARVIPLALKIGLLFTLFLLMSNFATNYINLTLHKGELLKLMDKLLVKDLKELYNFVNNQYEIYEFRQDLDSVVDNLENNADRMLRGLDEKRSIAFGVRPDGTMLFFASKEMNLEAFEDNNALTYMKRKYEQGVKQESISFSIGGDEYFGVYKYNESWDTFIIRAEELAEFYSATQPIFVKVAISIIAITLVCVVVGIMLLRIMLRFVNRITHSIMNMQESQNLEVISLEDAPNDEITYLGASFNQLSSTIDNLMTIFKKFVAKDIAQKAYKEREIRLEGASQELVILFSDIKGFTNITETLGNDIINLINIHYDRAIKRVHRLDGIVGSIIGDALLAVFGVMDDESMAPSLKAYNSIIAGYQIQEVAASLRKEMHRKKEVIVQERGGLTELEEKIYKAVLVEVGVGLDGGVVFYGNIGSYERMTNTVIGDRVNASSRLEGLTRVYKLPVICSEYVQGLVAPDYKDFTFMEIDTVQVKGKTIGQKIFWPVPDDYLTDELKKDIGAYSKGLAAYYKGNWAKAYDFFGEASIPVAEVMRERTSGKTSPQGWNGIWAMTTK